MLYVLYHTNVCLFVCLFIQRSEVSMMSAASEKSESIKNTSKRTEAGGGGSFLGFGAKASTSFGKSTSTGKVEVMNYV